METKFNFNSQVCTSRLQSEKLLALGLKKETADCYYWQECDQYGDPNGKWHLDILNDDTREHFEYLLNHFGICLHLEDALFIPAWSLHRLIELTQLKVTILLYSVVIEHPQWRENFARNANAWDNLCYAIKWLIKEGYFNKEYLV